MANKEYTDITIILDKSGSMGSVVGDTIGGFNHFLKEQQDAPGHAAMTMVMFDTIYSVKFVGKPIKEVPPLTGDTYRPGGCTALLDAIARGIQETGKRLSDMKEEDRPYKVVVVILTDGQENSSVENGKDQVKEMITHQQEKYKWEFIFLGANMDATEEAGQLGIQKHAFTYAAQNVGQVFRGVSSGLKRYRSGGRGQSMSKGDFLTPQEVGTFTGPNDKSSNKGT